MKKLCYIIAVILLISCKPGRNAAQTPAEKAAVMDSTLPVSAKTKMFMQELQNEMKNTKKGIKQFLPSASLVDKYSLQKIKGTYYVHGFIRTNKDFKPEQIKTIGVYCGRPAGDIRTVQVPLKSFYVFLEQKGITYFQVAEKVSIDKSK